MSSSPKSKPSRLKFVVAFLALPYLAGYFVSARNLELVQQWLAPLFSAVLPNKGSNRILLYKMEKESSMDVDACYAKLVKQLGRSKNKRQHFEQLTVVLHRNGQADACGTTGGDTNLAVEFRSVLDDLRLAGQACPQTLDDNKYQIEALLTRLFHKLLLRSPSSSLSCQSEEADAAADGLYGFCDMGEARTPILLDHHSLVPVGDGSLPCHFHTASGVRVTSLQQLSDLARRAAVAAPDKEENECRAEQPGACAAAASDAAALRELHLYAVPAGRVFMHSAAYVGQVIDLPHVRGGDPKKPVYLEVLSVSPAVFDLHNFFTRTESQDLVHRALAETKESHRIKRSTTGNTGANVNERRTSESGYDTDGKTSVLVKK